jgi:putative DNA primase/helicase
MHNHFTAASPDFQDREPAGQPRPTDNIHLSTALLALAVGLSPGLPIEDGSKRPDGLWKQYQTTPATREEVIRWYRRRRTGNALFTGYGDLEALEWDSGGAAYQPFLEAAEKLGLGELVERIRAGYEEQSPSGGFHWLYRCSERRGSTALAKRPNPDNPDRPQVLIETRGVGGFLVTAPSNGKVHPSGEAYTLLRGGLDSIVTITPEERDALWALAESFDEMPEEPRPEPEPQPPPRAGSGQHRDGVRPGDDFNNRMSFADILEPAGWEAVHASGPVTYWRRPGKDHDWSATTGKTKGFKVFTTSTSLKARESYSRFGLYCQLRHRGDWTACVKDLVEQGYGTWVDGRGEEHQNPPPKRKQPGGAPPPDGSAAAEPPNGSAAGEDQPAAEPLNLTELGNARRLIVAHGDRLRYCKPLGLWLEWDDTRWRPDQTGAIWRWAKDTVRRLGHEAAEAATDQRRQATLRWALKSEEKKVLAAMIELAWSEPGIAIMPAALDADPWLLNTPSGTVDLKTGKLRPHRQEDLITKMTKVPFDPDAKCPRWEKTLLEIFADQRAERSDDERAAVAREMVAYVQRALGYSLAGVIGEHALFLCCGIGRNGKNTVLDTVHEILGDYATVALPRTFMAAGQNDHLAMVADLMGRRFVPTDEVEDGQQLAESVVKRLTGNKILKARFMRQNPFEFPALFKVWMPTNHKPEIKGQDEGIWSRIRVIPFERYFTPEERIKDLASQLVAEEGPGILAWLVKGCLEWQRLGLKEPEKVLDAITDYRAEQDTIGGFIEARCNDYRKVPNLRDVAKAKCEPLYSEYLDWCRANGLKDKEVLTSRKFGSQLKARGFKLAQSNGVSYRLAMTLKSAAIETRTPHTDGGDPPY